MAILRSGYLVGIGRSGRCRRGRSRGEGARVVEIARVGNVRVVADEAPEGEIERQDD